MSNPSAMLRAESQASLSPGRGSTSNAGEGKDDSAPPVRAVARRGSVRQSLMNFKYYQAIEEFKSKNEEENDSIEDIRLKAKKFMSHSVLGKIYEKIIIVVSIMSAILYIHETYALNSHNTHWGQEKTLEGFDIGFAIIFLLDWCLNMFLADSKVYYFWSFFSWVDILIVITIFATENHTPPKLKPVNTFYNGMMYSLFAFRTVRILRALRAHTQFSGIVDAVDRYVAQMALFASVFILFFSALMQFLEKTIQPLPFHTWIYYTAVTVATVGYGDVTPKTATGRVLAMCIIGFAVISVPVATNELIAKMKLQSVYMRAIYTPKSRNAKHILICGDLSSTSIKDFFEELFHEDHENDDLTAVILLPKPPTVELILLMQGRNNFSVTYLEGSALTDVDLQRAKAETASAIFIMTNKFSSYPDEEDSKTILLNFSIKRYISEFEYFRPKVLLYCMQLLKPDNRRHLTKSNTNELDGSDLVVCLNEIKMNCMAQAVLCPGANTLLMNLLTSFADDAIELDEDGLELSEFDTGDDRVHTTAKAWFDEYQKGCSWEIYITKLAKVFDGAKFNELSYALYDKKGVVLLGLQLTDRKIPGAQRLLLNPGNFTIPSQDDYDIEAFVIAKNKASSDLSFADSPEQTAVFSLVTRKVGSVAYVLKNATVGENQPAVGERRRSSLKDINKLKLLKNNYAANLEAFNEEDSDDEKSDKKKTQKESKWKKLKRSALLERKVKSNSFQEVIHRLEDEHLVNNYYMRPSPILDLEEITIKSSVAEELPYVNNHIIIVGKTLKNVYDLIKPLRATHLGPMKFIVILHPQDVPLDVWRRVSNFDGIFFIRGTSLEEGNLKRAGIFRASTVVVLTDAATEQLKNKNAQSLVDSDAIFCYQLVKRLNPETQTVIEIVNQSNIGYLEDQQNPSLVDDPKFSPQFAAGTLFTTGLLDSIICQAYYNPEIIKVVTKLLSGMDQLDRAHFILKAAEELGHVDKNDSSSDDSDDSNEEIRLQKKQRKENLPAELLLHKARRKLLRIPNSCLYQISIPDTLDPKNYTYGALYQLLAGQGVIPLGILRGTTSMGMGRNANRLPYVFTNPPKETPLYACDSIFVLSTKPEKVNSKTEIKDWIMNLQMQQNLQKMRTNSDSPESAQHKSLAENKTQLRGSIIQKPNSQEAFNARYEKSLHKLEDKWKSFSSEIEGKLKEVMESMEKVLEENGGVIFTTGTFASADDTNTINSDNNSGGGGLGMNSMDVEHSPSVKSNFSNGELNIPSPSNQANAAPSPASLLQGVFRKNSVKKRHSFSNPLVPSIHEEPSSSNHSTVDEKDRSDEESKESKESKESRERKVLEANKKPSPLPSSQSKQPPQQPEQHPTFSRPKSATPKEIEVISEVSRNVTGAVLERAISGISMDFSAHDDDADGDGEDEILDVSFIEPIPFPSQHTPPPSMKTKPLPNTTSATAPAHKVQHHYSNEPEEKSIEFEVKIKSIASPTSSASVSTSKSGRNSSSMHPSIDTRLFTASAPRAPSREPSDADDVTPPSFSSQERQPQQQVRPISAIKEPVTGPKLQDTTLSSVDRLAKIKSMTEFVDTKSGKIRKLESK